MRGFKTWHYRSSDCCVTLINRLNLLVSNSLRTDRFGQHKILIIANICLATFRQISVYCVFIFRLLMLQDGDKKCVESCSRGVWRLGIVKVNINNRHWPFCEWSVNITYHAATVSNRTIPAVMIDLIFHSWLLSIFVSEECIAGVSFIITTGISGSFCILNCKRAPADRRYCYCGNACSVRSLFTTVHGAVSYKTCHNGDASLFQRAHENYAVALNCE